MLKLKRDRYIRNICTTLTGVGEEIQFDEPESEKTIFNMGRVVRKNYL